MKTRREIKHELLLAFVENARAMQQKKRERLPLLKRWLVMMRLGER